MKKKGKLNIPRHKRMLREARLQAANHWIPKYEGKNIVNGYSKHFAVDKLCAVKELEILGYKIDPEYIKRLKESFEGEQKAKQRRKQEREQAKNPISFMDSDDRFYYIAGYTSAGFAYGTTWEEMDVDFYEDEDEVEFDIDKDSVDEEDDYMPF